MFLAKLSEGDSRGQTGAARQSLLNTIYPLSSKLICFTCFPSFFFYLHFTLIANPGATAGVESLGR